MLGDGLRLAIADLEPVQFLIPQNNDRISLWITDVSIQRPSVVPEAVGAINKNVSNSCELEPSCIQSGNLERGSLVRLTLLY